ncbi:MAG: HDOD domain-containing protein [Desulfobacterales bacterium]
MKNPPKIFNKINTAIPLPCHPRVLIALNRLCTSGTANLRDMARLATMDPALTIKLMRLPRAGDLMTSSLEAIERCMARLGPATIKNVALLGLSTPLSNPLLWKTDAYFNQFWLHSLRCAVLARSIGAHLLPALADEAYTAGLLHDVGKLLLWSNFKKDYEPLFKKSVQADGALPAENDRIGTNHCEAGWSVIRALNTHPFVADAVLYHHCPLAAVVNALPLVKIVFLANILCHRERRTDPVELARTLGLDLPVDRLDHILAQAQTQTGALLEEAGVTAEALEKGPSPTGDTRDAAVHGIIGEFRELCVRHLTFEHAPGGSGPVAIQKNLCQVFNILFDVTAALLFIYDPLRGVLVSRPAETAAGHQSVERIELPTTAGRSLPALALGHRQIYDSFGYLTQEVITIADEQVIRLLDAEGMLCLPLVHDGRPIAVICAGIDEPRFPLLWEQLNLLTTFTDQAAALLDPTLADDTRPSSARPTGAPLDDEAIGRVLHEVNNPLGIVKNYLAVIGEKIAGRTDVKAEIALIQQEIERIPGLIAQLSAARAKPAAGDELLDINGVISDLSKLLSAAILEPAHIALTFVPEPNLPPWPGKKSHLSQVLINLLINSAEAMPSGGRIFMTTASEPGAGGTDESQIIISIRDDGPGIPAPTLARLFEPGVSDKGGTHLGLGLSISKELIDSFGGAINCRSRAGRGTTFRISLPVSVRRRRYPDARDI